MQLRFFNSQMDRLCAIIAFLILGEEYLKINFKAAGWVSEHGLAVINRTSQLDFHRFQSVRNI